MSAPWLVALAVFLLGFDIGVNARAILLGRERCFLGQNLASASRYPETIEGLKTLLGDILAALREGRENTLSAMIQGLVMPNHATWFKEAFGEKDGATLEGSYFGRVLEWEALHRRKFAEMLKREGWELVIERMDERPRPDEGRVGDALRRSAKRPLAFYIANWQKPGASSGWNIGYFVYLDGGFREIDVGVLSQLSALQTPPSTNSGSPPRIRVGGQVQQAKLIKRAPPKYPIIAIQNGIVGVVRLQVIVARDGGVKEVALISGPPILAEAAIEAVRTWQYQPTLLNGLPVEVVTTVDVVFTLNP